VAVVDRGGQPLAVSVKGRITYRDILTGFLVAEVRYSDTISPASVPLDPTENTLEAAQAIDRILANSVTAGRATRAVTGFDHLMQDVDLSSVKCRPPCTPAARPPVVGSTFLYGRRRRIERRAAPTRWS
jgi:hypothetical protein